jgi:DNA-binding response OmpR family regulator
VEKIEMVFNNLLSNAFKNTAAGDRITVSIEEAKKSVQVSVADTGVGIAPEHLPKLFDRFFYATEIETEQESSGIGLALTLELVKLHEGEIQVSSDLGLGSVFSVQLPLRTTNLTPIQRPSRKGSQVTSEEVIVLPSSPTEALTKSKSIRVLLVEDNSDVRLFIRKGLAPFYEIQEAINGKEGLAAAFKFDPDLIISDVMMPEMNGFELCKLLKTDLRTSHIPVILLTAKAAQEEKIEGLETGADDYLVKPFNTQELQVRIQNLIRLRQTLRQRFATSILLKPKELNTNSVDEVFLKKAMLVMEENMGNEDFNIVLLAADLQVSKATLNRKFRSLLDQSANDFIKSIRLQRAADLLGKESATVSEIAFQTGFRSTAYFVKSFKDHFGVTPGNYKKE